MKTISMKIEARMEKRNKNLFYCVDCSKPKLLKDLDADYLCDDCTAPEDTLLNCLTKHLYNC